MSERKINLSKILEAKNNLALEGGYANYFTAAQRNIIFKAMEESIKQTLELAAENAILKREPYFDLSEEEKLISSDVWEEGCDYPSEGIVVNKQSILNTINQIECK